MVGPVPGLLQQQLKASGFDLDFDVVEWGAMLVAKRSAPTAPASHNDDALNNSLGFSDPSVMFRYFATGSFSPNGINWGHFQNDRVEALLIKAQETFVVAERDQLLAQAHAIVVDQAPWLFVVHDLNPRALSPHVRGFRPAQSWYQDFTQLTVE